MQTEISYTLILHHVRKKLGLSLNDYCIAEAIYHLSTNPRSKISGWCYASKETLAEIVGISRVSVYTILNKLIEMDLIEKKGEQQSFLRTTKKWYMYVIKNKTVKKLDGLLENNEKSTEKTVKKLDGLPENDEEKIVKKLDDSSKNSKETLPKIVKKLYENSKESLRYSNNKNIDKNRSTLSEKVFVSSKKNVKEKRGFALANNLNFFEEGISAEQMVASRFSRNYSHFRKKTRSQYNCNDLTIIFCIEYYKKYGIMYSAMFGGADSRNLKAILRSQSPETMVKVIPYFIKNYEKIPGIPKVRPTVSILYGWRNRVISECLLRKPEGSSEEKEICRSRDKLNGTSLLTDADWTENKEERIIAYKQVVENQGERGISSEIEGSDNFTLGLEDE